MVTTSVLRSFVELEMDIAIHARPTAVNVVNAKRDLLAYVDKCVEQKLSLDDSVHG
jgi:hypothetical protein